MNEVTEACLGPQADESPKIIFMHDGNAIHTKAGVVARLKACPYRTRKNYTRPFFVPKHFLTAIKKTLRANDGDDIRLEHMATIGVGKMRGTICFCVGIHAKRPSQLLEISPISDTPPPQTPPRETSTPPLPSHPRQRAPDEHDCVEALRCALGTRPLKWML